MLRSQDSNWKQVFKKLKAQKLPDDQTAHYIVKLGKPFSKKRILQAKDLVSRFLNHPNSWVRHEAMWFLGSWGKLREFKPALLDALRHDPEIDNRSFAALCLAHLLRATRDPESLTELKEAVLDDKENSLVRLSSYGALLEIAEKESGTPFFAYNRQLSDINWDWVRSLPQASQPES